MDDIDQYICQYLGCQNNAATCAVILTTDVLGKEAYLLRCETCLNAGVFSRAKFPILDPYVVISLDEYIVHMIMRD